MMLLGFLERILVIEVGNKLISFLNDVMVDDVCPSLSGLE